MERGPITVRVEYAAVLHLPGLANGTSVALAAGSTVADLLRKGGVPADKARFVIPVVNGAKSRLDASLSDGDRVVLRLPMGGG
jgi:sulfur carrier protein ThiS